MGIELKNLSIHLPLRRAHIRRRMISSRGTGGEMVTMGNKSYVAAVNDISLHIKPGHRVALVGQNGAGKTTLLRAMAGVYPPTVGSLRVTGKIATLFSSTLSLSDFETGRQNIEVSGALRGIPRKRVKELLPEVMEFTGLGDFIDVPLSMYSEGMKVRLGFAMAVLAEPDVLLVDEVLTTGDAGFLQRARKRVSALGGDQGIVVIASHSREVLAEYCNHVLWLERGRLEAYGPFKKVMGQFEASLHQK